MRTLLDTVDWRRVVIGPVLWALVIVEIAVLTRVFPEQRPGCHDNAVFGCADWRPYLLVLASLPAFYGAWWLLLRRLGGRLPGLGPAVITAGTFLIAAVLPHFDDPFALVTVVAAYLVAALGWEILTGIATGDD